MAAKPFAISLRVYYEDTDAGGVVYHANYLRFMERCRSEWMVQHGFPLDAFEGTFGAIFVVTHLDARFHKAARLMDALTVTTQFLEVRRVQFKARQTILRGDELLFDATVSLACLDKNSFKPVAIPQPLLPHFQAP
jgi:tol-pal system-associated acyl-CoA thioesterase